MKFKGLDNWLLEEFGKGPKTFAEVFRIKNKWVPIPKTKREELIKDFRELPNITYESINGVIKDLSKDNWDVWYSIDIDGDANSNLAFFGKRTPFGVKLTGYSHDKTKESRKKSIYHLAELLYSKGAYIESFGKAYMMLRNKFNVDVIREPKIVQAVLDKPIQWHGEHPKGKDRDPYGNDAWYSQKIGDKVATRILMGNPILDILKQQNKL